MSSSKPSGGKIGPGRLLLVVGPSGAGKDTLIRAAREACRNDADIVFPRRVITRPSSAAEDHATASDAAFDQAAANGAFALWWAAHGLKYGIPAAIDDDIRAGRTVVCNTSRAIVVQARERFTHVDVVLVTAPPDVLAERLQARGRESDDSVMDRVRRVAASYEQLNPDVVIENTGAIEAAAGMLLRIVSGQPMEPTS